MNTFPHGIHPPANKERSAQVPVSELPAPNIVRISLSQHLGKEALPVVAAGDYVKAGQKIGEADGLISAAVFSSVSGKVLAVEKRATVNGHANHVCIENDGKYEEITLPPLKDPKPEEIISRIAECGIVGMGGAGFPVAVKLNPREKIDSFIINAAECEPYLTCDYRIMLEYPREFLLGAQYMARSLGLSRFYIGIEDNKSDAAEILETAAKEAKIDVSIILCHTKYPQGAEKQLIYAVTKRKVRVGKLPSSVGVIVDNVHTALSVYAAVEKGVPSYKRVLTVSGGGVKNPANFWARTGTDIGEVLNACGGIDENAVKLIVGGPMMGFAQSDENATVTKTTSGILLLTADEAAGEEASSCINCASCVKACPMQLMPVYIDSCILSGDVAGAEKYGAMNCIECGSCAYVCPAHRPLVQSIRLAKKKIREKGSVK